MQPVQDKDTLSQLLERCVELCGSAEAQLESLSGEKASFLLASLGDALTQMELILRVVEDEREGSPKREARQGLLKRLFARDSDDEADESSEFQPPTFDVSTQGLHGHSATVPLPELLSFLTYGKKTGVLWVDSPAENFLVGLVDGQLRHANSDHTPEGLRLGEVLVGLGYLTHRQLERFLERQGSSFASVTGEMLLETGMIAPEELQSALEYQTRNLFARLVETENAIFRFREGMQVALAFQVELDVNQLLLDSARAHDEAAWANQKIAEELDQIDEWEKHSEGPAEGAAKSETSAGESEDEDEPASESNASSKDRADADSDDESRERAA
jgi:hypothetical protein